jgi:hypothetical protein
VSNNKELGDTMALEKISRFVWLVVVWLMYDLAYDGIFLKSIHRNTLKMNINFDGNDAVIFGVITFLAGTYVLYLFFKLFRKKKTNNNV